MRNPPWLAKALRSRGLGCCNTGQPAGRGLSVLDYTRRQGLRNRAFPTVSVAAKSSSAVELNPGPHRSGANCLHGANQPSPP
ncbi:MAG: hypothetical protein WCF84_00110 [Anaerolineae bacterium]